MLYSLRNVVKSFDQNPVLDLCSIDFEKGQIYTLLGPNGAGKSTLLYLLAFLEQPTSGTLFFEGEAVSGSSAELQGLRKRVVLLDQSPVMFTGTVGANVSFGLNVRKINDYEKRARVANALKLVGLDGFENKNAKTLSGGQTKRVALARVLAVNPDVLLLDEPTANVDMKNQHVILDIIEKLNSRGKTSVIFSTHQHEEADFLAHHVLHLKDGKVFDADQQNRSHALVKRVAENEMELWFELFDFRLKVGKREKINVEDRIQVSLHPEKLIVNPSLKKKTEGSFMATLKGLEHKKDGVYYQLVAESGEVISLVKPHKGYLENPILVGQSVQIEVPPGAVSILSG